MHDLGVEEGGARNVEPNRREVVARDGAHRLIVIRGYGSNRHATHKAS